MVIIFLLQVASAAEKTNKQKRQGKYNHQFLLQTSTVLYISWLNVCSHHLTHLTCRHICHGCCHYTPSINSWLWACPVKLCHTKYSLLLLYTASIVCVHLTKLTCIRASIVSCQCKLHQQYVCVCTPDTSHLYSSQYCLTPVHTIPTAVCLYLMQLICIWASSLLLVYTA